MINLYNADIDLEKSRFEHHNFFKCFITKKLRGYNCDFHEDNERAFCRRIHSYNFRNRQRQRRFSNFFIENNLLTRLIIGEPTDLIELNDRIIRWVNLEFNNVNTYSNYINNNRPSRRVIDFFKDVNKVFDYSYLSRGEDYNSYTLTENLDVRVCTYCNRMYTITQRKNRNHKYGRLMNPQLDHWFPQSKYPFLQISFYNLIPSCEICNSRVKNSTPFSIEDDFHPYQRDVENLYFSYRKSFLYNKYQIYFSKDSDEKIKRTAKKMFIDQMYNGHQEELSDLITLRAEYSEDYIDSLRKAFPSSGLSKELVYRLAFGTELNSKDFHKRPMSKFKHDILTQLGIIKNDD